MTYSVSSGTLNSSIPYLASKHTDRPILSTVEHARATSHYVHHKWRVFFTSHQEQSTRTGESDHKDGQDWSSEDVRGKYCQTKYKQITMTQISASGNQVWVHWVKFTLPITKPLPLCETMKLWTESCLQTQCRLLCIQSTASSTDGNAMHTSNQRHHPNTGDNAYRQDILSVYQEQRTKYTELITISIVTIRSISSKVCVRLYSLCKISIAILLIVWRQLPIELINV